MTKRPGGFVFPISFPFSCEPYDVVWAECIGLNTRKQKQKEAYEELFQHRKILDILSPIVIELLNGKERKKLQPYKEKLCLEEECVKMCKNLF